MRRGEIWWAEFRPPFGSEPGTRRPVLILQSNDFTDSPIQTVVTAALTSNLRLAEAPGNIRCRPSKTGLSKPSVINVSQVATLDKSRLTERAGALDSKSLARVEMGVRLVLGL